MRLLRDEEAERLGPCEWCKELIYKDEPHHIHVFHFTKVHKTVRGLYCEHCAVMAGWIPAPPGEQVQEVFRTARHT